MVGTVNFIRQYDNSAIRWTLIQGISWWCFHTTLNWFYCLHKQAGQEHQQARSGGELKEINTNKHGHMWRWEEITADFIHENRWPWVSVADNTSSQLNGLLVKILRVLCYLVISKLKGLMIVNILWSSMKMRGN